jgi:hypothetical protein
MDRIADPKGYWFAIDRGADQTPLLVRHDTIRSKVRTAKTFTFVDVGETL